MARNTGATINNNLSRGLITEATGLNFPDNAVTETYNCIFEKVGKVTRRKGLDIEGGAQAITYTVSDGVIKEFIWDAVALSGGYTFLVLQIGSTVHFYELTLNTALSSGVVPTSIDLTAYQASGASEIWRYPCNFAAGSGYLFITHPFCEPIIVRFNELDDQFEAAQVNIYVRDYQGVTDGLATEENPTNLTDEHHYNLRNQGWNKKVRTGNRNNELDGQVSLGGTPPSLELDWEALV